MGNLTNSKIDRQNILNNDLAITKVEKNIPVTGYQYNDALYFTNEQLAAFFEVDIRTIERVVENNRDELINNGYQTLSGKKLDNFKKNAIISGTDIHVGTKTTILNISSFRTLLNFAMLLTNSSVAKETRTIILDTVINLLAQKTGGEVKFINQRDTNYLPQALKEKTERKKFTNAIDEHVEGSSYKYGLLTNEIYKAIFHENANEYKKVLQLNTEDNARKTMYSEILLMIASFESGLAYEIKKLANTKKRKISISEVQDLIKVYSEHPLHQPYLQDARTKMASRDLGFRDALHYKLKEYIEPVSSEDFEKFLGEQSKSLEEQIDNHKDLFKRLKDK